MKITGNWVVFTVVLSAFSTSAHPAQRNETSSPVEIIAVRDSGVDLKLRSVWSYPVSVWVCDTPERLQDMGYDIETLRGKKWVQLRPRRTFGDYKPMYLEVGQGRTDSLPANFPPASLGIRRGMTLRIVVRAWRTESNFLGTATPVSGHEPLRLISKPFVWMGKP